MECAVLLKEMKVQRQIRCMIFPFTIVRLIGLQSNVAFSMHFLFFVSKNKFHHPVCRRSRWVRRRLDVVVALRFGDLFSQLFFAEWKFQNV
jgi:hypothetical protein